MRKSLRDVAPALLLLAAAGFFVVRVTNELRRGRGKSASTPASEAAPAPAERKDSEPPSSTTGSHSAPDSAVASRDRSPRRGAASREELPPPPFAGPAPSSPRPELGGALLSAEQLRHWTEPRSSSPSPASQLASAFPPGAGGAPNQTNGPRSAPQPATPTHPSAPSAASSPGGGTPPPETPAAEPRETLPDDGESDRLAPVLSAIQFEPRVVQDGGQVSIGLEVHDDRSGVKQVYGNLQSPNGRASIGFGGQRQPNSDVWIATITVPKGAESGSWFVSILGISDTVGNSSILQYNAQNAPPAYRLEVQSAEGDDQAPTLRSVRVARASITQGETNGVTVECEDQGSGVRWVSGSFRSPGKYAVIGFGCRPTGVPGVFQGEVSPPAGGECGDWTLYQVQITDGAGNSVSFGESNSAVAGVSFSLTTSASCDGTPPVLDAISLAPSAVSNTTGGEVTVVVEVHDTGSGVRSVTGRLDGPGLPGQSPPRYFFGCTRPGTDSGPWIGTIKIEPSAPAGVWQVAWIQVEDASSNIRGYTALVDPVLANAKIRVE